MSPSIPLSQPIVTRLSHLELPLYTEHLLRLSSEDRYLRFGYNIREDAITRYVDSQYRTKQVVLGLFVEDRIIAAIEIIFDTSKYSVNNKVIEIGLSVEPEFRNIGYGSRLFNAVLSMAKQRGVSTIISHCLARNHWMVDMAVKLGVNVSNMETDDISLLDYASFDGRLPISNPGFFNVAPFTTVE